MPGNSPLISQFRKMSAFAALRLEWRGQHGKNKPISAIIAPTYPILSFNKPG
jgi:hypothetical protein